MVTVNPEHYWILDSERCLIFYNSSSATAKFFFVFSLFFLLAFFHFFLFLFNIFFISLLCSFHLLSFFLYYFFFLPLLVFPILLFLLTFFLFFFLFLLFHAFFYFPWKLTLFTQHKLHCRIHNLALISGVNHLIFFFKLFFVQCSCTLPLQTAFRWWRVELRAKLWVTGPSLVLRWARFFSGIQGQNLDHSYWWLN